MKKFTALLLCLLMIVSAASVGAYAQDNKCTCSYTPIVSVKGRYNIYKDKDNTELGLAERNTSGDDAITDAAKNITGGLISSLITDDWNYYADVIYDEVIEMYDGYALNNDGEIDNNSGIDSQYSMENQLREVEANKNTHRYSRTYMYDFVYDCRIDTCENAGYLNDFIEKVKQVTGHDRVIIITRCLGGVITNAYLNMFGYDSVEKLVLYNSIACGAEIADSAFTGNIVFDGDALNRFCYEYLGSSTILDLVKASVNLAQTSGALDIGTDMCSKIYAKVLEILIPRLIRDIFGKCPGWYGMVSCDRFEEAKAFILCDNEDGKYNKLIEKIDNYNYNYKVHAKDIVQQMQQDGIPVYIIAKYNDQLYPVVEDNDALGDNVISVYKQTYCGATCAKITKTLSSAYLATADSRFISPDKTIDASTGLFPEHTWYFRDLPHDWYPGCTYEMVYDIVRYNGYADINTFEKYPQFMKFEGESKGDYGTISPITVENADEAFDWPDTGFLAAVVRFFRYLIAEIKSLLVKTEE